MGNCPVVLEEEATPLSSMKKKSYGTREETTYIYGRGWVVVKCACCTKIVLCVFVEIS